MTSANETYWLISDEDDAGHRLQWRLLEIEGSTWAEIARIGGMPAADAKDWAALQVGPYIDDVTWHSVDGTSFSSRWLGEVTTPMASTDEYN